MIQLNLVAPDDLDLINPILFQAVAYTRNHGYLESPHRNQTMTSVKIVLGTVVVAAATAAVAHHLLLHLQFLRFD